MGSSNYTSQMKMLLLTFLILASVSFIAAQGIIPYEKCLEKMRKMIKIINMSKKDFMTMSLKEFPGCTRPEFDCECEVNDGIYKCTSKAYYLTRIKEDSVFENCEWPRSFY